MDLLHVNQTYNVLICTICKYAIHSTAVARPSIVLYPEEEPTLFIFGFRAPLYYMLDLAFSKCEKGLHIVHLLPLFRPLFFVVQHRAA
jgi:hypothetical protein